MNKTLAKLMTCWIPDKQKRKEKRNNFIHGITDYKKIKLIMTLVMKDEEAIIEKNIRFHHAMGVDGFIVINHNSTDRTQEILEKLQKEGLILEIIEKTSVDHQLHVWVTEMVKLAKIKYKADWIINADADEFYYSRDLNLKKSIVKYPFVTNYWVDSRMLFPDDREDFLTCPYFLSEFLQDFEVNMVGLENNIHNRGYTQKKRCPKVIHNTKDFISIAMGNHAVVMKNQKEIESTDIKLYHYHIKSYAGLEAKVINYLETVKLMPEGVGGHQKRLTKLYQENKLREFYDSNYNKEIRQYFLENGVITIDKSVSNFLEHKKIL